MARISAKVAGFALIVLSIGFNTWRYPAVREMVGASPCVSESNELSPTALIRGPESPLEPRHGTAPTVALKASRVEPCDSPPAGRTDIVPAKRDSPEPTECNGRPDRQASPSTASVAAGGPADTFALGTAKRLVPVGRLVPVVRPVQTAGHAADRPPAEPPAFNAQVIRLPPIGSTASDAARQGLRPFPSAVIPIYPTTGY